jgi:DNA-directed RNA polymerase subunit F
MIYLRLGDPESALKAYEDLVDIFPSNADAIQKIISLKGYLGINTL